MDSQSISNLTIDIIARDATRYLSVACTAALYYDHLLLIDKEAQLVWSAVRSPWKIAFLVNRYIVPLSLGMIAYRLASWNALDRPRESFSQLLHDVLRDGAVYFLISICLRLFNVVIFAGHNMPYKVLTAVATWALITIVSNRMLVFGASEVYEAYVDEANDGSGLRPYGQLTTPFKLNYEKFVVYPSENIIKR
ncbi:hypothetical protein M422DRAFT_240518 [Sphaerobolus stellatus SS14]|nr:hypothetical protein M422DRAFT_240518 [Sphaerobolus stellatus SS14]